MSGRTRREGRQCLDQFYDDGTRLTGWRVAEIEDVADVARLSVCRAWYILGDGEPLDAKYPDDALRALPVAINATFELVDILGRKSRRHRARTA